MITGLAWAGGIIGAVALFVVLEIAKVVIKAEVTPRLDAPTEAILRWTNRQVGGTSEQQAVRLEEMHDHLNQLTPAPITRGFRALADFAVPAWSQTTVLRQIRWDNVALYFGPMLPGAVPAIWILPRPNIPWAWAYSYSFGLALLIVAVLARHNWGSMKATRASRCGIRGWRRRLVATFRVYVIDDGPPPALCRHGHDHRAIE